MNRHSTLYKRKRIQSSSPEGILILFSYIRLAMASCSNADEGLYLEEWLPDEKDPLVVEEGNYMKPEHSVKEENVENPVRKSSIQFSIVDRIPPSFRSSVHQGAQRFRSSMLSLGTSFMTKSIYIKDSTLEGVQAPEYTFGTLHLWRNMRNDVIDPNIYLKAATEFAFLALGIGWIMTALFIPDQIRSNPIKDRIGYNNACVGWDMPPASYVSIIFVGGTVHFGLRCSSISILKYDLLLEERLISRKKHMWAQRATCWYAIALLLVPVILVCTPMLILLYS